MAWANRDPGLKPAFLYCWFVGDTLNLIGSMMSDASFTQKMLAWWYSISDALLLVELCIYGSPHPWSPRRAREVENAKLVADRTGWRRALADSLCSFSRADDVRVLSLCVILTTACFGVLTVVQLKLNPEFEITPPTEVDWVVTGLAWAAMIVFSSSRVAALWPAFAAHRRGEQPALERFSVIFLSLLLMNVFQLVSIFALSTDQAYLVYEMPWIAAASSPPVFDL